MSEIQFDNQVLEKILKIWKRIKDKSAHNKKLCEEIEKMLRDGIKEEEK